MLISDSRDVMDNPFLPSFGQTPPTLVGRDDYLAEFGQAFTERYSPNQVVLIVGARGMGKTVLLNCFEDIASENGWLVIEESSSSGLLDRLTKSHLPKLLTEHHEKGSSKMTSWSGAFGPFSAGASWEDRFPAEATLRAQIDDLLDILQPKGQGLAITVDEIQAVNNKEIRKISEVVQFARRAGRPLAFAGGGITHEVGKLLQNSGTTFLRRARKINLRPLNDSAVAKGIELPIKESGRDIDSQALRLAINAAQGYPYMIQAIGYFAWRQNPVAKIISISDMKIAIAKAHERYQENVLAQAWIHCSDKDREFLIAMAKLVDKNGIKLSEVANYLGVSLSYASVYRRRLENQQLIVRNGDTVYFAMPYMKEFLLSVEHDTQNVIFSDLPEEPE